MFQMRNADDLAQNLYKVCPRDRACRADTAGILLCGDLVVRSSAAPAGCDMRTYGGGLSRDRDGDGADRGGER